MPNRLIAAEAGRRGKSALPSITRDHARFYHPEKGRAQKRTMATKLDKTLKRELDLDGRLYTVTISPEGVKVVEKGKRNGQELSWRSIVSGDARLIEDLKLSIDATAD
jgi:hypothetical protein